jgi:hypothetical protein
MRNRLSGWSRQSLNLAVMGELDGASQGNETTRGI